MFTQNGVLHILASSWLLGLSHCHIYHSSWSLIYLLLPFQNVIVLYTYLWLQAECYLFQHWSAVSDAHAWCDNQCIVSSSGPYCFRHGLDCCLCNMTAYMIACVIACVPSTLFLSFVSPLYWNSLVLVCLVGTSFFLSSSLRLPYIC